MLQESLEATITRKIGYVLSRAAYTDFKKRVDYSEYGGAPLLGVKGVCIVCHGRSNANAIKNAIRVAAEFSRGQINHLIEHELAGIAQEERRSGLRTDAPLDVVLRRSGACRCAGGGELGAASRSGQVVADGRAGRRRSGVEDSGACSRHDRTGLASLLAVDAAALRVRLRFS